MQFNEAWINLFRRIPADLHNGLIVGLRSGAEVAIQTILKLEPDFIIMRGRLTGTQEGSKIMLMPYAEMTVLSVGRPLKDPEVEAIFGKGDAPATIAPPQVGAPSAATEPTAEDATATEPAAAVAPPRKPEQQSKSALLAKLRERLKETPPTGK